MVVVFVVVFVVVVVCVVVVVLVVFIKDQQVRMRRFNFKSVCSWFMEWEPLD